MPHSKALRARCQECGRVVLHADRKYSGPCTVCGVTTCPRHTHFYLDGNSGAITNSARPRCRKHASSA